MTQTAVMGKNLGDILLREGLITEDQYNQGIREYELSERPLSRIFVDMGAITENVKIGVLQKRCECTVVSLNDVTPRPEAAMLVPTALCVKYHLVPLRVEKQKLVVAMEDPTDMRALNAVEASASMSVQPVLAKVAEIEETIRRMPQIGEEGQQAAVHGPIYHMMNKLLLPALCGGPTLVFFFFLFTNRDFQKYIQNLELTTFDYVLYFVLSWSAWSIICYWIDGLIFRREQEA